MIVVKIEGEKITCHGLIPGQEVYLILNGKSFILHRHGKDCQVYDIDSETSAIEIGG